MVFVCHDEVAHSQIEPMASAAIGTTQYTVVFMPFKILHSYMVLLRFILDLNQLAFLVYIFGGDRYITINVTNVIIDL